MNNTEIDKAVAEALNMKFGIYGLYLNGSVHINMVNPADGTHADCTFTPSTNWQQSGELLEGMQDISLSIIITRAKGDIEDEDHRICVCRIYDDINSKRVSQDSYGETIPMAICKAVIALKQSES